MQIQLQSNNDRSSSFSSQLTGKVFLCLTGNMNCRKNYKNRTVINYTEQKPEQAKNKEALSESRKIQERGEKLSSKNR